MTFYCDPQLGLMTTGFMDTGYSDDIVREAKRRGWMINGNFVEVNPALKTIGPVARDHYVEIVTQVVPAMLARLMSSETIGLATQGANRDLFSGFEIRMDDAGRKSLSDFTKTCKR